ncbi:ATP-dependent helicase [Candidatus Uhrbacteria bacterium]|nr:ATP-dependent helicase [Candidatus Uhrbacteria bacterium]
MSLLDGLNPAQREAVTHGAGPLMIVAGAGTGKTTVITKRIAYLIEQKLAAPEQILALTFTDKAAGEMEERVDLLLPIGYLDLHISTFHAFAERLLRDYAMDIGLSPDFTLVNDLDAWLLVQPRFDRFELDYYRPLGNPTKHLRSLLSHFSRLKEAGVDPARYLAYAEEQQANADGMQADEEKAGEIARLKELAGAYHTYQQILLENDRLDLSDLMLYALKLLRERPTILASLRETFTYILVDEFQDTNQPQYEIIKLLANPRNNLTVVGDDDQAIYRFRGATLANILSFEDDFPGVKKVVLTENYRSSQKILDTAYDFIQHNNPDRLEKEGVLSKRLVSQTQTTGIVEHIFAERLDDEVESVVRKILELKATDADCDWNDFAILTRSNDAAMPFAVSLERRNIPFQFLALRGLYVKPVVLDLLAFLRVVDQPQDSVSIYRALVSPVVGLSSAAVSELTAWCRLKGKPLFQAMETSETVVTELADRTKIQALLGKIKSWGAEAAKRRVRDMLILVAKESGYMEYLNSTTEREKQEGFSYLQQLYERLKKFEERHDHPVLRHFLLEFEQERNAGEEGALTPDLEHGPDMVRLMTIHGSKGLEFKYVFVVNLVDRRFPSQMRREPIPVPPVFSFQGSDDANAHLQEERRLFYVAMTRAKRGLFLTSARDYGGERKKKPSRFLSEIGFDAKEPTATYESPDPLLEPLIELVPDGTAPNYRVPKQFSFTQLTAYETCPLQYKFAHVLKIPIFGRWSMSFGKTMHYTLQQFFELWVERGGKRQGDLFGDREEGGGRREENKNVLCHSPLSPRPPPSSLPVSLSDLLDLYNRSWIDEWYPSDDLRESYRERGRKSLVGYYQQMEAHPPVPKFLEQAFMLKIGDVVVKGRIDRVDACGEGVEIVDYKTGAPKTKLERQEKEQLLLYQFAARDVLGLDVRKLTYHYLEDNTELSFLGSDVDLLTLQESIVSRVQSIRSSAFLPDPGRHCRFCDFADICEFREE